MVILKYKYVKLTSYVYQTECKHSFFVCFFTACGWQTSLSCSDSRGIGVWLGW